MIISDDPAGARHARGAPPDREELVDALAEVHAVDWRAGGLEGFGKPTGYLERQLRRFNGLWEHNKTRELPVVQEVGEWLAAQQARVARRHDRARRLPARQRDVRRDAPARLVAVFDWELATIGDPLADLGYLTVTWAQAGDRRGHDVRALSPSRTREGFPTRDELVARYEERSGRSMATCAGTRRSRSGRRPSSWRATTSARSPGATDDPYLKLFDEGVPQLAEAALEITDARAEPERAARRLRRRAHDQRLRVLPVILRGGGAGPGRGQERCSASGPRGAALLRRLETRRADGGRVPAEFGPLLGIAEPEGLVDRLFAGMRPDERMVDAVGAPARRDATGLISNSWARAATTATRSTSCSTEASSRATWACTSRSPRSTCSGPSGPASSRRQCVFVDDLARTAGAPRRSG